MPSDWIPNPGTQLERAIRALFITKGAATVNDCFISNDSRARAPIATGITDILASASTAEGTENSGNEKFRVTISNKFGAVTQPGEPNPQLNRIELDQRVGRQMNEMFQGDLNTGLRDTCANLNTRGRSLAVAADETAEAIAEATRNADMAEFTVLFARYLGANRGQPDDNSCAWIEVRNFEITVCPSLIE